MNKRFYGWFLFVGVLLTAGISYCKENEPIWLTPANEQALVAAEPAPPAPGSPEDQADVQAVVAAQAGRTNDLVKEANLDASYSPALFETVLGPGFKKDQYPVTFALLQKVNDETARIVGASKGKWNRPRPFKAHPEIKPLFDAGGTSYPSGHSTHSFAYAAILGELWPDKKQAFLDRAHLIAQSRVTAGVHHPSDIKEGEVLGRQIADALLAKPEFQTELKAAEAELKGK